MSGILVTAFGLLLLVEGGPLLLAPARWRDVIRRVSALADGQLRFFGLMMVLTGVALVIAAGRG